MLRNYQLKIADASNFAYQVLLVILLGLLFIGEFSPDVNFILIIVSIVLGGMIWSKRGLVFATKN